LTIPGFPVITHACKTGVLNENVERKLLISERKILRRIFEPREDGVGTWSTETNDELYNLIINNNKIIYI